MYKNRLSPLYSLEKLAVLSFFILMALSLAGCSSHNTEFPSLVDRGMVPLSTTNPFQAGNLLISHEIEAGTYLEEFLANQGAPRALEMVSSGYSNLAMYLYYPTKNAVFIADLQEADHQREWIVRGPYGVGRKDFLTLRRLGAAEAGGEPVFRIRGRDVRFRQVTAPPVKPTFEPEIPVLPPVKQKIPARKQVQKKTSHTTPAQKRTEPTHRTPAPVQSSSKEELSFDDPKFVPMNSDQLALMLSEGYAAKTAVGDISHVVKSPKETLKAIATWYTGDETHTEEIAQANGLNVDDPLTPGMKIKIPKALVARTKAMPLSAFEG